MSYQEIIDYTIFIDLCLVIDTVLGTDQCLIFLMSEWVQVKNTLLCLYTCIIKASDVPYTQVF